MKLPLVVYPRHRSNRFWQLPKQWAASRAAQGVTSAIGEPLFPVSATSTAGPTAPAVLGSTLPSDYAPLTAAGLFAGPGAGDASKSITGLTAQAYLLQPKNR